MRKSFLPIVWAYIKREWIWAVFIGYELVAVILAMFTKIDIAIPCLFTKLTGTECLGCGMTRATMSILKFDFERAWHFNKLSFIVLPILAAMIFFDFKKFYKSKVNEPIEG
ncbi:MAG: hypothetical protein RL062_401 [Bacteroidota bacterium]|jgi:hypothetical protein